MIDGWVAIVIALLAFGAGMLVGANQMAYVARKAIDDAFDEFEKEHPA